MAHTHTRTEIEWEGGGVVNCSFAMTNHLKTYWIAPEIIPEDGMAFELFMNAYLYICFALTNGKRAQNHIRTTETTIHVKYKRFLDFLRGERPNSLPSHTQDWLKHREKKISTSIWDQPFHFIVSINQRKCSRSKLSAAFITIHINHKLLKWENMGNIFTT